MTVDLDIADRLIAVLRNASGVGDLHPFNLLADGDRVTVLDWSAALLAPRALDVGYTSLLLSEPPLHVPGWQRPLVRRSGRVLARRFVRGYRRLTATTFGPAS